MTRQLLASLFAAALALGIAAAPAEARPRRGAVAAGAIIGLATGVIVGSALANRHARDDRYVVTGPVRHRYHYRYAEPHYGGSHYAAPHYGGSHYYGGRHYRGSHYCGPGAFCRPHSGGASVGDPAYGY